MYFLKDIFYKVIVVYRVQQDSLGYDSKYEITMTRITLNFIVYAFSGQGSE